MRQSPPEIQRPPELPVPSLPALDWARHLAGPRTTGPSTYPQPNSPRTHIAHERR